MQTRYEIIYLKEHIHPQDSGLVYLVQLAVDGTPCTPFWSHAIHRRQLGEEAWMQSLRENAESLVAEYGRAPALHN
jgi:hypothetical protein